MNQKRKDQNNAPRASENQFYAMALAESKDEIEAIRSMFVKATEEKNMEDACRAAETLARIRQAAMVNATRMNIIIAEANMRAQQQVQAAEPLNRKPGLTAVKNEDADK